MYGSDVDRLKKQKNGDKMTFAEIISYPFILLLILIVIIILAGVFALLVFWLWTIVHCLNSKLTAAEKLFWIIIIILFNIIGALLYIIFSKAKEREIARSKDFKGKWLSRSRKDKIIAGVCGGIGDYCSTDPTLIRLLWILFIFMTGGAGVLAYIIA
ncbi:MAG: PspC domain-containing protein, partial [archaeon]|nr:PspC domain-containing protein [archaeon]